MWNLLNNTVVNSHVLTQILAIHVQLPSKNEAMNDALSYRNALSYNIHV